jgi:hypothetical protein
MTRREPHIHTATCDVWQRPFEGYQDQPDTGERVRLQVQSLPFGLPERVLRTAFDNDRRWPRTCPSTPQQRQEKDEGLRYLEGMPSRTP